MNKLAKRRKLLVQKFTDLALRLFDTGDLLMLEDFFASTRAIALAGRWDELDKFFSFTEKLLNREQNKLDQIYDLAISMTAKLQAARS